MTKENYNQINEDLELANLRQIIDIYRMQTAIIEDAIKRIREEDKEFEIFKSEQDGIAEEERSKEE